MSTINKMHRRSTTAPSLDPVTVLEDLGSPRYDQSRKELFDHLKQSATGRQWIAEAFRVAEGMPEKMGLTELCPDLSPAEQPIDARTDSADAEAIHI